MWCENSHRKCVSEEASSNKTLFMKPGSGPSGYGLLTPDLNSRILLFVLLGNAHSYSGPRTKHFVQLPCRELCNALNARQTEWRSAAGHKWGSLPAVIGPGEFELSPTFSSCRPSFSWDNSARMWFGTCNPEQRFPTSQGADKELTAWRTMSVAFWDQIHKTLSLY